MTIANRETGRDALVSLLSTALVGTGKPATAVFGYRKGDFDGASPVVTVTSNGTGQEQKAITSRQKNEFFYEITTFTLYALKDTTWGEDDTEDRMDLLEKTIRETIAGNVSTVNWAFLEYAGKSEIYDALISGVKYCMEVIPVRMEIYDN